MTLAATPVRVIVCQPSCTIYAYEDTTAGTEVGINVDMLRR